MNDVIERNYQTCEQATVPILNINNFKFLKVPFVGTGSSFSHQVSRGYLDQSTTTWICKEINNPVIARMEVLVQELFRLIIPHQPETRLGCYEPHNTYYIFSEEVKGYRNLPKNQAILFTTETYTGLGEATFCAFFFQESDLKNGNIGLNEQNRVIKIDGDWCFSSFRMLFFIPSNVPLPFNISPEAIQSLPYPHKDFYTNNWLDARANGRDTDSLILKPFISTSPQFRAEVNRAMLKICLLPDSLIETFISFFMPAGSQRYIDLVKTRRETLKNTALQIQSFRDYLVSSAAKQDATAAIEHICSFKSSGINLFTEQQKAEIKGAAELEMRRFEGLCLKQLEPATAKPPHGYQQQVPAPEFLANNLRNTPHSSVTTTHQETSKIDAVLAQQSEALIKQEKAQQEAMRAQMLAAEAQAKKTYDDFFDVIVEKTKVSQLGMYKPASPNNNNEALVSAIIDKARNVIALYLTANKKETHKGVTRANSYQKLLNSTTMTMPFKALVLHSLLNKETGGMFHPKGTDLFKALQTAIPLDGDLASKIQTSVQTLNTNTLFLNTQQLIDFENKIIDAANDGGKIKKNMDDMDIGYFGDYNKVSSHTLWGF